MRQIKFRGRRVDTGKFVFGDLMHMTGGRIGIIFDKRVAAVEVDPESVAQLVGHDSNGNEIYEGDIVVLNSPDYHIEYTAHLSGYATGDRGIYISAGQFDRVTLKEAQS